MVTLRIPLYAILAATLCTGEPLVQSVTVPIPGVEVKLSTQVGRPYDSRAVERDVRFLWSFGRFEDIRVETSEGPGDAVAVVFRATPRQFFTVREVTLEPNPFGLGVPDLRGARIDREAAQQAASQARRELELRGYAGARVAYELTPAARGEVDLKLKIDAGEEIRVGGLEFTGVTALPEAELLSALHALRPKRMLPGWRIRPQYTRGAVDAGVARLRSLYFFKGYVDAQIRPAEVNVADGKANLRIEVHAGARSTAAPANFCPSLFAERREAGRDGVLDFSASVDVDSAGRFGTAADRGRPYRVGRVQFSGNRHYSDAFLRRHLLLDEAALFDERRLRQSLARLNRTGLFENLDERSVDIRRNPQTGIADVRIALVERKRGSWNISGPLGPMSFAGPLQAAIGTHLPPWGRGIFELSTYTVSFSLFAFSQPLFPILAGGTGGRWLPVLSLARGYTPGEGWRSGFAVAPQLGWRRMAGGYLATQLQQRLLPALSGDRGLTPELPVTVHRPGGDTTIVCEPPAPRLGAVRGAVALALHAMGAFAGI